MGPLLTLAGLAILLAVGWRSVRRDRSRAVEALKKARSSVRRSAVDRQAPVTLERDPKTGVYGPPKGRG